MLRAWWLRLSYVLMFAAFVALCVAAYWRLAPDRAHEVLRHIGRESVQGVSERNAGKTSDPQLAVEDDTPEGRLVSAAATGDMESLRRGLDSGVSPNARNSEGRGALHLAAASGEVSAVRALLDAGAGIDEPDLIGWSPLAWASYYGSLAGATVLLDAGADPNARHQPHRVTPLEQLVGGWSRARSKGEPPLRAEDRGVIGESLFAAGADPNLGSSFGPPLRFAPDFLDDLVLLSLFFEHGARVDDLPELRRLADRPDEVGELFRHAFGDSARRPVPE